MARLRLKNEKQWGAMIGIVQSDMDSLRASLLSICRTMRVDMSTLESRLRVDMKNPDDDAEYNRYKQLFSMIGGLHLMLDGVDGVLSSLVIELLSEEDMEYEE